ncbi:ABC transporter ATP-binding protein [Synechococcus elongatus]|uniref:ATPase n=1 Tax=Synechococcus elongatus (strain ATCC 33912 / PCC 7942 / FACHB-805) TaxID=1140 RepID=Q31LZ6_SYNE7|nr:ABC transporter ATP-binding protein [Synechococcus elongatus]ABB57923.1 ATPase [Synechococcus elongatus PCC 7942 = FACHB-805]AJD57597.1 branched-chain amino acid ABC transporter ATPase [Synechococcus elongatus UTEX 2973]MBD2586640.1 ABC transporter ATP-binding protein [Synechococcus elongatus FACHB-242]MBD2687714.1 ABC transporter ATP-binding protein [Synechococcus elongatus FACHB-1061]MBD2706576.1 ABC transporter ATP-binding protein [Synechococcus elongatus PCC 7942 = FACHB-805]
MAAESWLLEAEGLSKRFGGLQAVQDVRLQVAEGTITGLIGPNGAGKSTLFALLSNFLKADAGKVRFRGRAIEKLQPYQLAQLGLVRTFQVARSLSRLTVLENMLLGGQQQRGEKFWQVWLHPQAIRRQEQELRDRAFSLLSDVGLAAKAQDYAGSLSGGQRKLLEMARALMAQPQLVLLDEPAAGVNPALIEKICDHIQTWNQQGISFLIIEHNMDVIMSLCDRVWVLAEGKNLVDGPPAQIQQDEQVLAAYLGLELA